MAYGVLGVWHRLVPALIAAIAAFVALVPAAGAAGSGGVPAGWRSVSYGGASLAVPSAWAVHDLASEPGQCARADMQALYLGHQATAAACPAHLLGRTDAVHLEPLDAAVQPFDVQAAVARTLNGIPIRVNPDPAASRTLIAAIDGAGLLLRITYGVDATLPDRVLSTLSVSAAAPSNTAPVTHAPAMPAALANATPGVFTGAGFDTCSAPPAASMRAWMGASPYQAAGIYIGGTNAACLGGNLNASWVSSTIAMGWHLIPIYVGLQAPCAMQSGLAGIDGNQADAQGVQNADDALKNMQSLGIGPGNPVFFDMEAYKPDCAPTVTKFLAGWARELRARGYLSGVYSGVGTGVTFMLGNQASWPDELWFARWDGTATTSDSEIPAGMWWNHQRMKQYSGGHDEAYASTTINIDSDSIDTTLVGR
jgi:hypothetical protein